jgi:anti-sigma factor RsiW
MTPRNPLRRRHYRGEDHLRTCAECAAALQRERQYIERLRSAAVPPASDDLTARLLARTEILAAVAEPARGPHPAARVLALTGAGTAAAAGILALSAFALAGDTLPVGGTALNGSLAQNTTELPADGRDLTAPQLTALRSEGWVCPGLESMGFHVQGAKAITLNGRPAVEMHLSDGQHYATVVEQHRPAAGRPGHSGTEAGKLQISNGPWTATYETAAGTFTVESNLPADRADDALPQLQRLSALAAEGINVGVGSAPDASRNVGVEDTPVARLERGIRKIGELLTR